MVIKQNIKKWCPFARTYGYEASLFGDKSPDNVLHSINRGSDEILEECKCLESQCAVWIGHCCGLIKG